ncbi:MAG: hypothetical protein ACFE9R_21115, partial [Candidatus Hermodarchaeota archaeon]
SKSSIKKLNNKALNKFIINQTKLSLKAGFKLVLQDRPEGTDFFFAYHRIKMILIRKTSKELKIPKLKN